ncbi:MAG: histone deacetylase [Phycisphaerales bacterium]|nr:histone deacetylase [Phycisphaerales bacterium]
MPRLLLLSHPSALLHDTGPGHPERSARVAAVLAELERAPVQGATFVEPRAATREMLERVHTRGHVDRMLGRSGRVGMAGDETPVSPRSIEAALLAAGAAVDAVEAVGDGGQRRAFSLMRPPGHHAEADFAMGFCIFNSIAVAAAHALATERAQRVLIVDWDVHHGNGTQHIFESRRDVLYFSVHQFPFYPGTGRATERGTGAGEGFTVNVPLSAGAGDDAYRRVFREILRPTADRYQPDLVLVSAGFDAHGDDPLGSMSVTEDGFADLTAEVCAIADDHASGRLALVLEGGYSLPALAQCVRRCAAVL